MKIYIDKLRKNQDLSFDESKNAFEILMNGKATDDEIFERQRGIELRDEYTDAIKRAGLARPPKDTNTRDRYNHMV